jgi:hypothetical protein
MNTVAGVRPEPEKTRRPGRGFFSLSEPACARERSRSAHTIVPVRRTTSAVGRAPERGPGWRLAGLVSNRGIDASICTQGCALRVNQSTCGLNQDASSRVDARMIPQVFNVPSPPQVCGASQVPQSSVPWQPSDTEPQFAPRSAQVRGAHSSTAARQRHPSRAPVATVAASSRRPCRCLRSLGEAGQPRDRARVTHQVRTHSRRMLRPEVPATIITRVGPEVVPVMLC